MVKKHTLMKNNMIPLQIDGITKYVRSANLKKTAPIRKMIEEYRNVKLTSKKQMASTNLLKLRRRDEENAWI